jgi:hypothetical protein
MTHASLAPADPFRLLLDPQSVLAACAESKILVALASRVYRPLDKPTLRANSDVTAFDAAIDNGRSVAVPKSAPEPSTADDSPACQTRHRSNSDILLPGFRWG